MLSAPCSSNHDNTADQAHVSELCSLRSCFPGTQQTIKAAHLTDSHSNADVVVISMLRLLLLLLLLLLLIPLDEMHRTNGRECPEICSRRPS